MEKFDLEALMNKFDEAGFNRFVLICPAALEISPQELILMLEQAEDIFKGENPDDDVKMLCHVLNGGSIYAAIINENEMVVAS